MYRLILFLLLVTASSRMQHGGHAGMEDVDVLALGDLGFDCYHPVVGCGPFITLTSALTSNLRLIGWLHVKMQLLGFMD